MRKVGYLCLFLIAIGLLLFMSLSVQGVMTPEISENLTLLPELLPQPGFYWKSQSVRMQPSHPRGTIIFTLDGSVPSANNGTVYSRPIFLDDAFPTVTTIRAVEVVGGESSPLVTASYAIGLNDAVPLIVLTSDPYDLWDPQSGLLVNSDRRGSEWERTVELEMIQNDNPDITSQTAGLRIIGDPLPRQDKLNFRLYFRTEYANPRLDFNPFQNESSLYGQNNVHKRLLLQAAREAQEINLVRDQLVADRLTASGMPAAQGRIVHLVINGDTWGLYRLTERVDNVYLEDTFNIDNADIVQEGNAREGSNKAWRLLLSWVTNHNMTDERTIQFIESEVNVNNLMTMACVQAYFQCPADAFYAVHPHNDRWFWVYEGGGSQSFQNSDFSLLVNHLMQNTAFRLNYAKQCGDMLNSELSSSEISRQFEALSKMLFPLFPLEQARWPNTPAWDMVFTPQAENLAHREFHMREAIDKSLGQQGIANFIFQILPPERGHVYVNGRKVLSSDEHGLLKAAYFIGTDVHLQAVSAPGYTFMNWQIEIEGMPPITEVAKSITLTVSSGSTISAHYQAAAQDQSGPAPDDVHINEYWIKDNGTKYASIGYRAIEGDWIELLVDKPGMDLRNWRITDNDTKNGTDEGSVILPAIDALASVPRGTILLLITTQSPGNDENFPVDDISAHDKLLLFYVGNGNLDISTDPGFYIDTMNDNLALLAPGAGKDFTDDTVIDFVVEGLSVTAGSFGAIDDNVTFDKPFSRLGNDDGVVLTQRGNNDILSDWIVDPDSCLLSGDSLCTNTRNIVTPGKVNPLQTWLWFIEKNFMR